MDKRKRIWYILRALLYQCITEEYAERILKECQEKVIDEVMKNTCDREWYTEDVQKALGKYLVCNSILYKGE